MRFMAALAAVCLPFSLGAQVRYNPLNRQNLIDVKTLLGFSLDESTPPTNGQVWTYSSATGKIYWATPPGAGGGEVNTASNVGTAGVGMFDAKSGVDLQFRKLNALTARIAIALDAANKKIDFDIPIQMSVSSDGSGLKLAGDVASPGNNRYYGTDGSGTKGWFSIQNPAAFSFTSPPFTNSAGVIGLAYSSSATPGYPVEANDSRLSNNRNPTAHAVNHQHGGSDEVATATPAANAVPKAGGGGKLGSGWLPDPTISTLGGVRSAVCNPTSEKVSAINTDGTVTCSTDQTSAGGGVSTSALTDLAGTKTSATVLNIGANCSTSAPCRVGFGTAAKTFTAAGTLTISGTSAGGTAHCWVDDNGIQCGHNSATTITGSGISVQTGITTMGYGWPIGSFTWTANVWDTVTAAMDKRMFAGFPAARPGADGSLVVTRTPGGWDEWSLANPKYIVIAAPLASANSNAGAAGGGWTHGVANTWYGGTQPFVHYAKSSPAASVYIFRMPEIWNGGQIKANLTAITSNNVNGGPRTWAFGIRVACLDDDAVVNTATYNAQGVQTVSMPNTSAVIHQRRFSILSGGAAGQFPLTGCAPNSYVKLELNRDVANGAESSQNEPAGIQDMQLLIPVL